MLNVVNAISIYILLDKDGNIRYVGKSINPSKRFWYHQHGDFKDWVDSFQIIETEIPEDSWKQREKFWIEFYRKQGCLLENKCEGGNGKGYGPGHTQETRNKMSKSNTGKIHSDKTKKTISESLTGRKLSENHKNNLRGERGVRNLVEFRECLECGISKEDLVRKNPKYTINKIGYCSICRQRLYRKNRNNDLFNPRV